MNKIQEALKSNDERRLHVSIKKKSSKIIDLKKAIFLNKRTHQKYEDSDSIFVQKTQHQFSNEEKGEQID